MRRYLLLAVPWLLAVMGLSRYGCVNGHLWLVGSVALLIAAPVLLAALYTSSVKLAHRAGLFSRRGLLRRLTVSRLLVTLWWTLWSLAFGLLSVFWLNSMSRWESLALLLSAALLPLIYLRVLSIVQAEVRPFYASAAALAASRWLYALILTPVFLLLLGWFGEPEAPGPLSPRLEHLAQSVIASDRSLLVQVSVRVFEYLRAVQSYLVNAPGAGSRLQWIVSGFSSFALFYNAALLLSGFLVPGGELRRVFAPVTQDDEPGRPATGTTVLVAALLTIAVLFLYLPGLASLEYSLQYRVATLDVVSDAQRISVQYAEQIDGQLYRVGTLAEIESTAAALLTEQRALRASVREHSRHAFAQMRRNVDVYLDHYYSLPAEYLRIASALGGNVEERIREELTATLMQGDAVARFDTVVRDALEAVGGQQQGYSDRIDEILERQRLEAGEEAVVVTGEADLLPLLNPRPDAGLLFLEQRMALSGVSAIGGLIAAKIVSKVAAKGAIKMAATGMSKIAATKLAAGPAGAALGAAVGSLVPVAGTLVGSAIGFTLGVALGVSVDALLLELEELYSRADFRDQILAAIDDQEAAFDLLLADGRAIDEPDGGQEQ